MTEKSACEIAYSNFLKRAKKCLFPPLIVKFNKLNPSGSAIIRILQFVKNHPNTSRKPLLNYYQLKYNKTISTSTFQAITWAELVTPKKYNITNLGIELLKQYNAD